MNESLHKSSLPPLLLLCLILAAGCAGTKPVLPEEENLPEPAGHLVFIGLDGWGGAYTQRANMPTVKRMMAEGASTLKMQCVMPSSSRPNWTALFCGTPPENQNAEPFPSIFTLVKNSGKVSVFFYEWTELQKICPDEIVEKRTINSDLESARLIADYITETKPAFTAVVFNEPDHTGFWGCRRYYNKLAELDVFIGIIEQALKDAGIHDDTVFMLSSDHGGVVWGHGGNTPRQRRIPLVIYGGIIKEGYVIPAQRSICDIAPTMAAILGLEVPPEWTGRLLTGVFK